MHTTYGQAQWHSVAEIFLQRGIRISCTYVPMEQVAESSKLPSTYPPLTVTKLIKCLIATCGWKVVGSRVGVMGRVEDQPNPEA